MIEDTQWPQLSLLDVLRPRQGWHATDALLSTYSLDLVVLVSALLALTDRDNLDGSGSKVSLANAIHHFGQRRRRLTVLVQSGRIAVPRTNATVLALLDTFVREVKRDQRRSSWHAKVALVRYERERNESSATAVEWRVWIGSRNLTRDVSWDTGLVLCSIEKDKRGAQIKGLDAMASALMVEADWDGEHRAQLLDELRGLSWLTPASVEVNEISWLDGNAVWDPSLETKLDALMVITPFFNVATLTKLAKCTHEATKKQLLTTQKELDHRLTGKLNRLEGWNVRCLAQSESDEVFEVADPHDEEGVEDALQMGQWDEGLNMGLHAKIIATKQGKKVSLQIGSANVTERAWASNTEVVVTLSGGESLWTGVAALMAMANDASLSDASIPDEEGVRDSLEVFRNSLCNLSLTQAMSADALVVTADNPPSCSLSEEEKTKWNEHKTQFDVAPLAAADGDYVAWPLNQTCVALAVREGSLAGESEFVCFRLRALQINDGGEESWVQLRWIQHVPLNPKPDSERDSRILAGYLSAGQFLFWISGMLHGYDRDAEPWDASKRGFGHGGQSTSHYSSDLPTVEALLRAWQRDKRSLATVSDALKRFFKVELVRALSNGDVNHQKQIAALERFRKQLHEIESAIGENSA